MATASQEADDVGGGSLSTAGLPAARRSRRLVASRSESRMLSPIEAITFMFQAHISRNGYHMAHMTAHDLIIVAAITHTRYPQLMMSLGGQSMKKWRCKTACGDAVHSWLCYCFSSNGSRICNTRKTLAGLLQANLGETGGKFPPLTMSLPSEACISIRTYCLNLSR